VPAAICAKKERTIPRWFSRSGFLKLIGWGEAPQIRPLMHLRALKVNGFKSFADSTELKFDPGVTAIVGPNGCGKSNIADAIR